MEVVVFKIAGTKPVAPYVPTLNEFEIGRASNHYCGYLDTFQQNKHSAPQIGVLSASTSGQVGLPVPATTPSGISKYGGEELQLQCFSTRKPGHIKQSLAFPV